MLEDTATYYVERRDGYLGTELSLPGALGKNGHAERTMKEQP
ncbi:MAG: hypothetical protein ACLQNE_47295 [Thermoguttaceae bacterium]